MGFELTTSVVIGTVCIGSYLLPSVLYLTNAVLSSIKASTVNFSQYNDVITAMVGWSHHDQRKTIEISTGL